MAEKPAAKSEPQVETKLTQVTRKNEQMQEHSFKI